MSMNIPVDAACAAILVWTCCLVAAATSAGAPHSATLSSPEVRKILTGSDTSPFGGIAPADQSRVRVVIVPVNSTSDALPRVEVYGDPSDPDHMIIMLMVKR